MSASTPGVPPTESDLSSTANHPQRAGSHPHINAAHATVREMVAVVLWTLLADLLIFRAYGFAGPSLFFALVSLLFFIGRKRIELRFLVAISSILLILIAIRLFWAGSRLNVASAFVVTVALSMAFAGIIPNVIEGVLFLFRVVFEGAQRLGRYRLFSTRSESRSGDSSVPPSTVATWLLPLGLSLVFASLFVLANPDLLSTVRLRISILADHAWHWLSAVSYWELPFCVLALMIGVGLMHPKMPFFQFGDVEPRLPIAEPSSRSTSLYYAFRNSLVVLILLFVVYLYFEFTTLWNRDFPAGFYYAGYAHQGAAWLTLALAIATAFLSCVFSEPTFGDHRVARLRRLAWIWSMLNLMLALSVYNRLWIYVGYHGMTRMRTIGFFGITLVVIGFVLVLRKMARQYSFAWLIRAQLIALVVTLIAFGLFPVDYVVHRYNVASVQSGYLHPSVMVAVKPIDNEGMLAVLHLTNHPDPIIRDGVRALVARRHVELDSALTNHGRHWTQFQGSTSLLRQRLEQGQGEWSEYIDSAAQRDSAIRRFVEYAMQWY